MDDIAKRNGRAVAIQGDVAKAADLERIFAETERLFGGLHVLVNNTGLDFIGQQRCAWEDRLEAAGSLSYIGFRRVEARAKIGISRACPQHQHHDGTVQCRIGFEPVSGSQRGSSNFR